MQRTRSSRGHRPNQWKRNLSFCFVLFFSCYYVNIILFLRVFGASFSLRKWNMTDRRNNDMMSIVNSSIHIIVFFNSHFDSEFKRNIFYTCWRSIFFCFTSISLLLHYSIFYTACASNITIIPWTKIVFQSVYRYRISTIYTAGTPFIIYDMTKIIVGLFFRGFWYFCTRFILYLSLFAAIICTISQLSTLWR